MIGRSPFTIQLQWQCEEKVQEVTLGIDKAVNAAFLQRLAALGGGACELVESEDRLDEVMDQVHRRIGTAVLTRLRLEPAGLRFDPESLPGRLPDVFAGSPVQLFGRYSGGRPKREPARSSRANPMSRIDFDSGIKAAPARPSVRGDCARAPASRWSDAASSTMCIPANDVPHAKIRLRSRSGCAAVQPMTVP